MPARVTVGEILKKLDKIVAEGGGMVIDWGKGDVYLVFSVLYDAYNPEGKTKLRIFMYDVHLGEPQLLHDRYIEKVDVVVSGADEVGTYANEEGAITNYYLRGRIHVTVKKEKDTGMTYVKIVSR
jgi:hypothetical protein